MTLNSSVLVSPAGYLFFFFVLVIVILIVYLLIRAKRKQ